MKKKTDKPRVGVLGAGQLALMLAQAGKKIGVEVICAGAPGDCAGKVAPLVPVDLENPGAVAAFAAQMDLVTIETENIDVAVLKGLNVFPNARAIATAQDRLLEKRFFRECGIDVAPFAPVENAKDLARALEMVGVPSILKTRRMGYDGKGQARLTDAAQATAAWESLGGVPCILEGFVRFDAEVSLIAARGRTGQIVFYPLTENFHRDGILRCSVAPFHDGALQRAAEVHLLALLEKMDYAGVLAVEFFVQGGKLLANEMAPRVHNSGHWTIEGSKTSQFENHLRAILGMDLGGTDTQGAVMLNCIGAMPPADETAQFPALHRHDYGKEPRPGRKVGHITFPVSASKDIYEWQKRLGVV
jgi:5-(carboxyamino)imidazole ribonucleotide synthase